MDSSFRFRLSLYLAANCSDADIDVIVATCSYKLGLVGEKNLNGQSRQSWCGFRHSAHDVHFSLLWLCGGIIFWAN